MVVSGANIPMTPGAEKILHERGVLCIPDFIANAGGVICAAMEYQGASEAAAMQTIDEKLTYNVHRVLNISTATTACPARPPMTWLTDGCARPWACAAGACFDGPRVAMYRIRIHGRGGQGIKMASRVLGTALFRSGFTVQDAPKYGAERRGAPIFSYCARSAAG